MVHWVHSKRFKTFFALKLTFSCSGGYLRFLNPINGVMLSMLNLSVINRWFEPLSGQSKYYKIGICCFSAKNAA